MSKFKFYIKFIFFKLGKKYSHFKIKVNCVHKWYGNKYGGFYICPDLLNAKSVVYSFGIGEDMSFDNEVLKNYQCQVFGFDPTPKSIRWVKQQDLDKNFHFYEYGIGAKSGPVHFYLPKNIQYVSGSVIGHNDLNTKDDVVVKLKSLTDIMNLLGHDHIDVLKMDIEGSEYEVIKDILNNKIQITQILIEFHDRFFKNGYLKSREAIQLLDANGYKIFAISDSWNEISFIKEKAGNRV